MPSILELETKRLQAAEDQANGRRDYEATRLQIAGSGVADVDDDPAVKITLANYEQAQTRYVAARREHTEALEAARKPRETDETA